MNPTVFHRNTVISLNKRKSGMGEWEQGREGGGRKEGRQGGKRKGRKDQFIQTTEGHSTWGAGRVGRGTRRNAAFFFRFVYCSGLGQAIQKLFQVCYRTEQVSKHDYDVRIWGSHCGKRSTRKMGQGRASGNPEGTDWNWRCRMSSSRPKSMHMNLCFYVYMHMHLCVHTSMSVSLEVCMH